MDSKFYEVSDETIDVFKSVLAKKTFAVDVRYQFIGSDAQKTLIKISKVSDQYAFLLEKDLLVTINEKLMSVFDDESIFILMEQEIDKIATDMNSGKIKMIKPDLTTFSALISKYGIEKISRANQVESLAVEQKEDVENEFII